MNIQPTPENQPLPVEPSPDTDDAEHVETDTKQRVIGTFITKTIGIKKKTRKAQWKICGEVCDSVNDLNSYHHRDHGFSTQRALDKHVYMHKDLKFMCDVSGKSFPFDSHLQQHKIVHRTMTTPPCMKKNCDNKFKNIRDLNRHVQQLWLLSIQKQRQAQYRVSYKEACGREQALQLCTLWEMFLI